LHASHAADVSCHPQHRTIPAPSRDVDPEEALRRARWFREEMTSLRSIRDFSSRPIDLELIEHAIAAAASAPSGANRQPWRSVVVRDPS
jgi:hypothetical protein